MPTSLSICIPVYNYNVTPLVKELHNQCTESHIQFEIIVIDDASDKGWRNLNNVCSHLSYVKYKELQANVGRSVIRNLLIKDSQYPYLLFLDCDVLPQSSNFINNYIREINLKSVNVIVGGRSYAELTDQKHYLRWLYGTKREELTAEVRNKHPYRSFMTNNFLISKKLAELVKFREDLIGYGHEDTFFGYELKTQGIPLRHINNFAVHLGLETNQEFLSKTDAGLNNLCTIYTEQRNNKRLIDDIKLLKVVDGLSPLKRTLIRKIWSASKILLNRNLLSNKPSLKVFDFYKLGFIIDRLKA